MKTKVKVNQAEMKRIEELNNLVKLSDRPREIQFYEKELRSIAAKALKRERKQAEGKTKVKVNQVEMQRIEELNNLVKLSNHPQEIKLYEKELRSIAAKALKRERKQVATTSAQEK
ncbi:hypothetical protein [Salisediminibacterium halotolerans]|uniref:hypothetical protein n=1 Tax=Salisediminibacterium halotolerans TaxID=517425 RepID=UPI000EB09713|nr:hypothetical protein [Salisediminibacterium halotolerans]RLJ72201.1 hypothetical protein BCL39_2093 [Actinophytocola xinjiangensis]RPE85414.1 hypothetical protein EDD67_2228 [Salisediminibacterium halotolerans]TWG33371.1 hypothetical protein BCL52_2090 [Salisediminibacterium halotolerans]GEL07099.1 hypothetical protein SHA02_05150 [Salisediminibacterium halotolerans]